MQYLLIKERKFVLKVQKKMMLRFLYRALLFDRKFSDGFRGSVSFILQRYYKRFFFSRVLLRCIFNGRSHSVHFYFKMARQELKAHVSYGLIYGVAKYGW